jgi:hypothetical protein
MRKMYMIFRHRSKKFLGIHGLLVGTLLLLCRSEGRVLRTSLFLCLSKDIHPLDPPLYAIERGRPRSGGGEYEIKQKQGDYRSGEKKP